MSDSKPRITFGDAVQSADSIWNWGERIVAALIAGGAIPFLNVFPWYTVAAICAVIGFAIYGLFVAIRPFLAFLKSRLVLWLTGEPPHSYGLERCATYREATALQAELKWYEGHDQIPVGIDVSPPFERLAVLSAFNTGTAPIDGVFAVITSVERTHGSKSDENDQQIKQLNYRRLAAVGKSAFKNRHSLSSQGGRIDFSLIGQRNLTDDADFRTRTVDGGSDRPVERTSITHAPLTAQGYSIAVEIRGDHVVPVTMRFRITTKDKKLTVSQV